MKPIFEVQKVEKRIPGLEKILPYLERLDTYTFRKLARWNSGDESQMG